MSATEHELKNERITDPTSQRSTDHRPQADDTKQSRGPEREPRLPHERDESADSQQGTRPPNDQAGRQGHADVERGLVDTDQGLRAERVERGRGSTPDPGGAVPLTDGEPPAPDPGR